METQHNGTNAQLAGRTEKARKRGLNLGKAMMLFGAVLTGLYTAQLAIDSAMLSGLVTALGAYLFIENLRPDHVRA